MNFVGSWGILTGVMSIVDLYRLLSSVIINPIKKVLIHTKIRDNKRNICAFQIAVKNSIDVFYFSTEVPMHVLFVEDGEMDKRIFLATWKDIPAQNEVQHEIKDVQHSGGR